MIQTIATAIAEPLDADGFRRTNLTWNRSKAGIFHVVGLQQSRSDEPDTVTVTINVGILVETVWRTLWDKAVPRWVEEEECFPRFRIGKLLAGFSGESRDQWWSAADPREAARIGGQLQDIIRTRVLPFFLSLQSVPSIKAFVDGHSAIVSTPADRISLAILAYQSGAPDQCDQLLAEFNDARLQAWRERVEGVRLRLRAAS